MGRSSVWAEDMGRTFLKTMKYGRNGIPLPPHEITKYARIVLRIASNAETKYKCNFWSNKIDFIEDHVFFYISALSFDYCD